MEEKYQTISGIPLKEIYEKEDIAEVDYRRDLNRAGEPPFTRGAFQDMYRSKPWRIFLLTGTGSIEEVRERVKYALDHGETGFIAESDMLTTWSMYDIDNPEVLARKEDVGLFGAPIMSLRDYADLYEGIPIGKTYCHFGCPFPQHSPFFLACFLTVVENGGIPLDQVHATGEGDFFLAYVSGIHRNLVPPEAGLRLNCDVIEYAVKKAPRITPVSIPGNNIRESGANAYQELAIVLANVTAYLDELLNRGLTIDDVAYTVGGINLSTGRDLFEDVCKLRAARRMWYKLMTDRYHAHQPRSLRLRIHALPLGSIYSYQQPLNNVVRGAYAVLAGALGGAQSMGTPSFDEAICTPSLQAHTLALRTQQILQEETNFIGVADPLGGSYYVEWLTNEIEKRAWGYLREIEDKGGFIACLHSGWIQRQVTQGAMEFDKKIQNGEMKWVGVNCHQMKEEPYQAAPQPHDPEIWKKALSRLEQQKRERDNNKVVEAKNRLLNVLESKENSLPATIEAVKAGVTIGEIGQIYKDVFGIWKFPEIV